MPFKCFYLGSCLREGRWGKAPAALPCRAGRPCPAGTQCCSKRLIETAHARPRKLLTSTTRETSFPLHNPSPLHFHSCSQCSCKVSLLRVSCTLSRPTAPKELPCHRPSGDHVAPAGQATCPRKLFPMYTLCCKALVSTLETSTGVSNSHCQQINFSRRCLTSGIYSKQDQPKPQYCRLLGKACLTSLVDAHPTPHI